MAGVPIRRAFEGKGSSAGICMMWLNSLTNGKPVAESIWHVQKFTLVKSVLALAMSGHLHS